MSSPRHHLAQVNIAKFRALADAPENADFFGNLDRINGLAEASPGFVWRLVGEGDNATDIKAFDDPALIINMSVWESLEQLGAFAYRSGHVEIMRRRQEWFTPLETYQVLWWVPVGHEPSLQEARERLDHLAKHGPTADAFTFRQPFPAPGSAEITPVLDECA